MDHRDLLAGWCRAVAALSRGPESTGTVAVGRSLLARWSEPHRHYHTAQHLAEMLAALEELSWRAQPVAVISAWLHDAVYDVRAAPGDSERASAILAREVLSSLQIGTSDIQLVEQLILLTIDHGTQLPGALADTFTDADLAILAAPRARFDEYCSQVRAEYAHVPAEAYAAGRASILRDLVDRPEVYRTEHARSGWTARARENVGRELTRLRSGLGKQAVVGTEDG